MSANYPEFAKLIDVMKRLRDPEKGCPWDLEQNHKTLLKNLIEEAYEYIHAVENEDADNMEEELGDVLLQVIFHATIAEQNNTFNIESVSKRLSDKLIYRHPHIFGNDERNILPDQVLDKWNDLKEKKKKAEGTHSDHLDKGYLSFPALYSSYKIGKKAEKVGFDWARVRDVTDKVEEEWQELKQEFEGVDIVTDQNRARLAEELGDMLFSMAQLARKFKLDPEETLRAANKKFIGRYNKMVDLMTEDNKHISNLKLEEMEEYWQEVKRRNKG